MKAVKWLDEHFEEAILIFFLVLISCVELAQVICRNVPFIPSLTWAEELARLLWIATVFISLPYTIRTESMLRVTALIDIFPWKIRNIVDVCVDVVNTFVMAVMTYYSWIVFQRILASGELSPAILLPMWIMYLIVFLGFLLGALRGVQMFIIHCKNINVQPKTTMEEAVELEIASGDFEAGGIDAAIKAQEEAAKAAEAKSAEASDNKERGDA